MLDYSECSDWRLADLLNNWQALQQPGARDFGYIQIRIDAIIAEQEHRKYIAAKRITRQERNVEADRRSWKNYCAALTNWMTPAELDQRKAPELHPVAHQVLRDTYAAMSTADLEDLLKEKQKCRDTENKPYWLNHYIRIVALIGSELDRRNHMLSTQFLTTRDDATITKLIQHYSAAVNATDDPGLFKHYQQTIGDLSRERRAREISRVLRVPQMPAVPAVVNNYYFPEGSSGQVVGDAATWETMLVEIPNTVRLTVENPALQQKPKPARGYWPDEKNYTDGELDRWISHYRSYTKERGYEPRLEALKAEKDRRKPRCLGLVDGKEVWQNPDGTVRINTPAKRTVGPQLAKYLKEYHLCAGKAVGYSYADYAALRKELKSWPELRAVYQSSRGYTTVTIDVDIREFFNQL